MLVALNAPSADDIALSFSDRDVVSYDDEFEAGRFVWMQSSVLLLGEAKVQDISCVIPEHHVKIREMV